MPRRHLAGAIAGLALALAVPATAHADTTTPTPAPASTTGYSQDFTSGANGWTQSTSYDGLCVPALLCPQVTSGDTGGYIRTQFKSLLSTLAGTSTGVWTSPSFTYDGNAGQVPASVALDLDIRPAISALLGLSLLNDTSYRVDLVDQTTGARINAVPATTLANDPSWSAIPSAPISAGLLTVGDAYQVVITTAYHAVATVVAGGEVGYDNVRLTAYGTRDGNNSTTTVITDTTSTSTTTNTTTIEDRRHSRRDLRIAIVQEGLPVSARLGGHFLKVRVACPARVQSTCDYRLRGQARGRFSPAATRTKHVVIDAGHHRVIRLRVKPRWLHRYLHAHKVVLRAVVRADHVRAVAYKRVRVLHLS